MTSSHWFSLLCHLLFSMLSRRQETVTRRPENLITAKSLITCIIIKQQARSIVCGARSMGCCQPVIYVYLVTLSSICRDFLAALTLPAVHSFTVSYSYSWQKARRFLETHFSSSLTHQVSYYAINCK